MIFTIIIAGYVFEIYSLSEEIYHRSCGYISNRKPDYTVRITQQDIDNERERLENNNLKDYECEFIAYCRKVADILCHKGVFLIHGSALSVDNSAHMFVANSGTGKSTHSRLWREYLGDKVVMINDDKPFIGIGDDGITVYGSPWNGKHRLGCNESARLKSICFLERSVENRIEPMDRREAYDLILQYIYRPTDRAGCENLLQFLGVLMDHVEFYRLGCNMEIDAAKMSYNALVEGKERT